MNIALVTSNNVRIGKDTKKGTEILFRLLIEALSKRIQKNNLSLTAFCSGDSELPVPIESIEHNATSSDQSTPQEKIIIFELALLSKAFSMQDKFDLYHIHIGDGDIVLPFARFVKKPILITQHYAFDKPYVNDYFSGFSDLPSVYYVSLSNYQRKLFPQHLQYIATVYNGIDTDKFVFDPNGGSDMMWSARGVPEKGLHIALDVVGETKKHIKTFVIKKPTHTEWLMKTLQLIVTLRIQDYVTVSYDQVRSDLINAYQKSKVFLFPTFIEEACPLSVLESMSCGTPVIAFARGAVPELIEDGKTGFIINQADNDIRGNWIVKKTGIEGFIEAVKRIYSMSNIEYESVRKACREHVEKHFTADNMAQKYLNVYKSILNENK